MCACTRYYLYDSAQLCLNEVCAFACWRTIEREELELIKSYVPNYSCRSIGFRLLINISQEIQEIKWDPLFSLDLTNVEPDVYCVEVFMNLYTCGGNPKSLLTGDCSLYEPT